MLQSLMTDKIGAIELSLSGGQVVRPKAAYVGLSGHRMSAQNWVNTRFSQLSDSSLRESFLSLINIVLY